MPDGVIAGIDLHIAKARIKHSETIVTESGPPPESATPKQIMQHKLRTEQQYVPRQSERRVAPLSFLRACGNTFAL